MYTTQQEPWKEFFSPRPEDIVYEDAHVIAFRDKTPQAARYVAKDLVEREWICFVDTS